MLAHTWSSESRRRNICAGASSFLLPSSGAPYSSNMISLLPYCSCDSGSRESVSTGCWFCHGCRHFNFCSTATPLFPAILPLRLRSSSSTSPVLFLLLVVVSVVQSSRFLAEISRYRINLLQRILASSAIAIGRGRILLDILQHKGQRISLIGKRSRSSHFYEWDESRRVLVFSNYSGKSQSCAFFVRV